MMNPLSMTSLNETMWSRDRTDDQTLIVPDDFRELCFPMILHIMVQAKQWQFICPALPE
jgi:hypothetical protein